MAKKKQLTAEERAIRDAFKARAKAIAADKAAKRAVFEAKIEEETAKAVAEIEKERVRAAADPSKGAAEAVAKKAQVLASRLNEFLSASDTPEAIEMKTALSRRIAGKLRQKLIETKKGPATRFVEAAPSGRDVKRAGFSEAAEKRQVTKASRVVRSIEKNIEKKARKQLGPRPNARRFPIDATDWDQRFEKLKAESWRRVAKDRTLPLTQEQVDRINALPEPVTIQQALTEELVRSADRAIGLVPVGKNKFTGETVWAAPNLAPRGGVTLTEMYAKSPPERRNFNPTPDDRRVKALVDSGVPLDEAIQKLGDAQYKATKEQYDAIRKIIREDPVLIEVPDPERLPVPDRMAFPLDAYGSAEWRAEFEQWKEAEHQAGRIKKGYVCRRCTNAVKTGQRCSCTLNTKLKLRQPKKFRDFKPPKRDPRESDANYAHRLAESTKRYEEARAHHFSRLSYQMATRANLPAEQRLLEPILKQVREQMGKPPRSGPARIEYDREVDRRAGEELQRQVARLQEVPGEYRPSPREEAPFVGTMRGPGLFRSMDRAAKSAIEKAALPGSVTVQASSKKEAEEKATEIAAGVMRVPAPAGSATFAERRIEKLQKEAQKGRLSPAKQMELNRLLASQAASVEKKLDGLGFGFGSDLVGTVSSLAVGGLVVFALFKALTSKSQA